MAWVYSVIIVFLLSSAAGATPSDIATLFSLCRVGGSHLSAESAQRARDLVSHFRNLPDQSLAQSERLEEMTPEEVHRLFDRLYETDPAFRAYLPRTTLSSYPNVDRTDSFTTTLERAVLSAFSLRSGRLLFSEGDASRTLSDLVSHGGFVDWVQHQQIPSHWRQSPEQAAREILQLWDRETSARNTPRPASQAASSNAGYEAAFSWARIGGGEYVASNDGKLWLRVGGSDRAPAVVPRWRGNADEYFAAVSRFQSGTLTAPHTAGTAPVSLLPANLFETTPGYNTGIGMVYLSGNRPVEAATDTVARTQRFIDAGAYGYHVTLPNRLQDIVLRGWQLDQTPTSNESARTPGLHLSTHLGVTYPIPGQTVILRTRLEPSAYSPAAASAYYGHVIRNFPIHANNVGREIQFSTDGGVSWYPLNSEMVNAMRLGLLPTERGRPL